jgi:hypothetical protein
LKLTENKKAALLRLFRDPAEASLDRLGINFSPQLWGDLVLNFYIDNTEHSIDNKKSRIAAAFS